MPSDPEIIARYKQEKPWGMSASIDLYHCNPEIIRNSEKIKKFVLELCDLIKMKRFGEPIIVDFGEEERVCGFSMMQLIETSLISGHFANQSNAVYIDIFSCKKYPPAKTAQFCKEFFEATEINITVTFRK